MHLLAELSADDAVGMDSGKLTLLRLGNHLHVWDEMHLSTLAMAAGSGWNLDHQDMQALEARSLEDSQINSFWLP